MFDKTIVIVTPWFGRFAGGAESLAHGMAREFNRRGVRTIVFTTCSSSPFESWWEDHYAPGVYNLNGLEVRRFATNKTNSGYLSAIKKIQAETELTVAEQADYFKDSVNSSELIGAVETMLNDTTEIIALPYFYGLTHSLVHRYPNQISLIPCFHDEPQFRWLATQELLRHAQYIFYNSPEEKELAIRQHGLAVGRCVAEGIVTGIGVELGSCEEEVARATNGLPENYFIYAGRKERGKNVPLLCEWFAAYAKASTGHPKLVFIGGGDANLIPSNDCFVDLGFVSEPLKRRVVSGARAMLNLSENESFSIVLMESWLFGAPVVVSATSTVMKGHVLRCNGGLFVANQDELSAALKFLDQNDVIRRQLALNGETYVNENFTFDRVLARYLNCFSSPQHLPDAS